MIKKYSKNIISRIIDDDFPGMAAEMAFMFVLGIFPFLLVLMSFFAWMGKKAFINKIFIFLEIIAPPQISNLINSVMNEIMIFSQGKLVAIFGFCITLFLASNAIFVIIKGLNRAYGIVETRNLLVTRLLSVLIVFANGLVLFLSINLIIFGKIILEMLLSFIHLPLNVVNMILIFRWPVSFLALFVVAYMNYYFLPDIKEMTKARYISSLFGTLFFCIFWLLGSWLFSLYVGNLNTYNWVYGTIGAFAMLMVWLYYTSLLILIGGEINSQILDKLTQND